MKRITVLGLISVFWGIINMPIYAVTIKFNNGTDQNLLINTTTLDKNKVQFIDIPSNQFSVDIMGENKSLINQGTYSVNPKAIDEVKINLDSITKKIIVDLVNKA